MKIPSENTALLPDHATYDVIISGAGPVGLLLACELALHECSVLILEKAENPHSPLKKFPFGTRGLSAPTIEILDRRGLLTELELHKRIKTPHTAMVTQGARRQAGHFAGIPFYEGDIDVSQWKYRLPGSTGTSLMSEMEELETALGNRAMALGVKILRGVEITDFQQTEDGVTVLCHDQLFKASWLAGCDGSRSIVRKKGGFEFAGTEPEFTGYSTQLEIADPAKLKPGRNVTDRGMYLQSQPGYLIMQDFDGGAFHHSKKTITPEHIQEVIRRISGTDVTVTALHIATTWTDRERQATHYRKGRVLLAGDAAHIHAPLGGQGLNLGLGDAMNLGWKLASTVHNKAPRGLLDSYHTERHPVGVQVLDWSRAQVAIMKPDPASRALYSIIGDLMNTRDGATYFAGRVWGIHLHYPLCGDHALTGYSIPNFALDDGTTMNERMQDGRGILLDFTMNSSLRQLAAEYGGLISYVSGKAMENFGLHAALIRPDGIVAWATDNEIDLAEIRQAADDWFVRIE